MTELKSDWVQLTKWDNHFEYPSQGTMRNICARRKENGAEAFLSNVNGRFYVSVSKFNEWMNKHSSQGANNESESRHKKTREANRS